jgi:mRNA interferase MazF
MATYIPERGDVVRISFNPQAGHEQAGWGPALVLSPKAYNARVGLALFCPVTHPVKGYPIEVQIPTGATRSRE